MSTPESLQALLDGASDAMLIVDQSGAMLSMNQHALDLFRYAPGELEGESVELLVPVRLRLQHIGHRLSFTDGFRMRPMGAGRELFVRCKDGSELPVEISLRSVQHGLKTLTLVAVRAR